MKAMRIAQEQKIDELERSYKYAHFSEYQQASSELEERYATTLMLRTG